jgi:hypothetical protein
VDTIVTYAQLGQMIFKLGRNWLMRGENTLVTSITQQKMLPAKVARVKVIRLRISNAKLDLVQKLKGWRVVPSAMNFHARK